MTTVFQNDFRIQLFFRIRKTTNPIIDDYCKVAVSEIQSIPEYGPYPPDTAFSGKSPINDRFDTNIYKAIMFSLTRILRITQLAFLSRFISFFAYEAETRNAYNYTK